jgi:hypothetical protein
MEVTKWLKPSDSVSRIGDSASVQAATRVNAEQALYGAFEVKHLFHGILHFLHSSFFVRLGIPFLRPDLQYCKAGARRSCQGWPSPQPCGVLRALPGHTLTASSTTARLMRSGRRSEGELAIGRGSSRHNLVFGRSIAT